MRRLTAAMAAGMCLVLAPVVGAAAAPGPASAQSSAPTEPPDGEQPAGPEAVPGEEVCSVADQRLVELSGLVVLEDGYAVLNDGTEFADRQGVFILDGGCQVVDQIGYPSDPRDPEDLALDREANVLWIGDIGDNFETSGGEPRPTVALWRVDLGGDRTPVIHRFTYPDGNPRDAEALLLTGDGTPIIVTKGIGSAELFVPSELRPSSGPDDSVSLEAVGEFSPQDTGTEHPLGAVAAQVVTGGANAPDNSAVVLRTYTDAYEFDVTDGDVVAAVTEGEPRITPLPGEPLGEAISYTADGERFLTVSEVPPDAELAPVLLSYAPAAPPAPEEEAGGEAAPAAEGGGGSLFDEVQDFINVIAAVGVLGVLLVAAGIFGIVRARKRGGRSGRGAGGPGGPPDDGPVTGRARLSGGRPGEPGPAGWESDQPAGVYTSQAMRGTEYGPGGYADGAEYGGGEYRGTEYGAGGGHDGGGGEPGYGADPYRGGYQDQPYDQEHQWSNGHREQPPAGPGYSGQTYQAGQGYQGQPYQGQGQPYEGQPYQGQGQPYQGQPYQGQGQPYQGQPYESQGYQGQGPPDPGYPAAPPEGGGTYSGGTYQSTPDSYRDDYSDDPDYRYEFRQQPGRWQ
jgi:hypothetical protein